MQGQASRPPPARHTFCSLVGVGSPGVPVAGPSGPGARTTSQLYVSGTLGTRVAARVCRSFEFGFDPSWKAFFGRSEAMSVRRQGQPLRRRRPSRCCGSTAAVTGATAGVPRPFFFSHELHIARPGARGTHFLSQRVAERRNEEETDEEVEGERIVHGRTGGDGRMFLGSWRIGGF